MEKTTYVTTNNTLTDLLACTARRSRTQDFLTRDQAKRVLPNLEALPAATVNELLLKGKVIAYVKQSLIPPAQRHFDAGMERMLTVLRHMWAC